MTQSVQQLYHLKQVAGSHLQQAQYSQAVVYLQDIVRAFEKTVESVTSEELMEQYIRELKLASHKNLSLCYLHLEKYNECIIECETVLEVEPNLVKILYRLGKAQMSLGQRQEAKNTLKRAFHLDPLQKEVQKLLETLEGQSQSNKKQSSQKKFFWPLSWLVAIIFFLTNIITRIVPRTEPLFDSVFELVGLRDKKKIINKEQQ